MSNITKAEIISNIKDRISEFKLKFNKVKENPTKTSSNLDFEINRDALKIFYKNKPKNEEKDQKEENKENINSTNILNNKLEQQRGTNNQDNNVIRNFTFGAKSSTKELSSGNEENYLLVEEKLEKFEKLNSNRLLYNSKNNEQNYMNNNNKSFCNINSNKNKSFFTEDFSLFKSKDNTNNKHYNKEDSLLNNIKINNKNYKDFNLDEIFSFKRDKRERSAPKISIQKSKSVNQLKTTSIADYNNKNNSNNHFLNNIKIENLTAKNNKINSNDDLYQKLLVSLNIDTKNKNNKEMNNSFYLNNNKNNSKKSLGYINVNEINIGGNNKNSNTKYNLNLDSLSINFSKINSEKINENFKSKIDGFYKELNSYKYSIKNSNKNPQEYKSFYNGFNTRAGGIKINYGNIDKNISKNENSFLNIDINKTNQPYNFNFEKNDGGFNKYKKSGIILSEVRDLKLKIKEMTKDEFNNLPINTVSELKELYSVLTSKFYK